jgi:hypothetical protein
MHIWRVLSTWILGNWYRMLLLVISIIMFSPSSDTKVEQGHFAEANLASSMDVVVVEIRVDSSRKVVGMVLDTYLSS